MIPRHPTEKDWRSFKGKRAKMCLFDFRDFGVIEQLAVLLMTGKGPVELALLAQIMVGLHKTGGACLLCGHSVNLANVPAFVLILPDDTTAKKSGKAIGSGVCMGCAEEKETLMSRVVYFYEAMEFAQFDPETLRDQR